MPIGPPRVVLEVVEIRRVVALVHALEDREVDLHQVLDAVEDAPDVLGVQLARHRLDRPVDEQIDIQFGPDLADGPRERDTVVLRLQRAGLDRQMLLEVSSQPRRIERDRNPKSSLMTTACTSGFRTTAETASSKLGTFTTS